MTDRDKRLQEIRERIKTKYLMKEYTPKGLTAITFLTDDIHWLLAEIERLEAELDKHPRNEYMFFPPTITREAK